MGIERVPCSRRFGLDCSGFLDFEQAGDASSGGGDHLFELGGAEDIFFAAALEFHEIEFVGHDDIHIDAGIAVFDVVQIDEHFAVHYAHAHGRDSVFNGEFLDFSLLDEPLSGELDGDRCAGDRSCARASIGLQDIAIHPKCALAEFFQIHDSAEGSADEALNLGAASVHTPARGVALFAGEGRVGEHGVFGRDPAAGFVLFFHPTRHGLFDRGGADDLGIAEGNEDRALGVRGDAFFQGDGSDLVGLAVVVTAHKGGESEGKWRRRARNDYKNDHLTIRSVLHTLRVQFFRK